MVLLLPAWYNKVIYGGIELSLRHYRWEEYIKASLKSCWKGSQWRWVLVDMHVLASWDNNLLFPPIIKAQRNEPPMTDRLSALVNRVIELCKARLDACHCIKEFNLCHIRPLSRWDSLAY
jgi:hypothetical protein